MAYTLKLPKWGLTMNDGAILEWMFSPGDEIKKGEIIANVEAEKATTELPSPIDGVLLRVLVDEGETVDVGTDIAIIADSREEYLELQSSGG